MNLRHLIGRARRPTSPSEEDGEIYYYLRDHVGPISEKIGDDDSVEDGKGKELPRLDSCAIFHKITSGKGVPHTFSGGFQCCEGST